MDEKMMFEKHLGEQRAGVDEAAKMVQQTQSLESAAYDNAIKAQRPALDAKKAEILQMRADTDKWYKTEQVALGTNKAAELSVYRNAIVDLKERGADSTDARIKLLEDTLDERKRATGEEEKDRDLQREAIIKVAQINAGSRENVANINSGDKAADRDLRTKLAGITDNTKKKGLVQTSLDRWTANETKVNGTSPTAEEIAAKRAAIQSVVFGN
jgi:hypothetical protein